VVLAEIFADVPRLESKAHAVVDAERLLLAPKPVRGLNAIERICFAPHSMRAGAVPPIVAEHDSALIVVVLPPRISFE